VSAYAVIKTGGKQLRVAPDDFVVVEKLVGAPGEVVSFGEVLMLVDGGDVKIGAPTLAGVAVHGEIADQRRADKIVVFKKRRRKNYRRKKGHRQHETVVRITALGGEPPAAGSRPMKKAAPKPKVEKKAKPAPQAKSAAKTSTTRKSNTKKSTSKAAGAKSTSEKKSASKKTAAKKPAAKKKPKE
jgi:large subunit ribosomal protein L21